MKCFLRNDKGAALITVIIITTIILLFGAVLVNASVQGFKLTKHSRNIDFARYAGDTAIENWFNKIIKKVGSDGFIDDDFIQGVLGEVNYSKLSDTDEVKNLANEIIKKIKTELNERQFIDVSAVLSESNNVEIDGKTIQNLGELRGFSYGAGDAITDFSEVRINTVIDGEGNKDLALEVVAADFDSSSNILTVTIGLTVNALYSDGIYSTDNRLIYAEKSFEIELPEPKDGFELEYAILTLGDLYVNNVTGNVKGDVNVYGTFPNVLKDPRQHYYGGIYAINKAKLNLMGNAYTRSFIRTGAYKPRALHNPADGRYDDIEELKDKSSIHIYKDAIAQNIQLFGNDSEIAVYRNAYTFVDLEINSENSILFINGSYVGLTKGREDGELTPHDNLSGIVNSAIIHNLLSEPSQKSRIFIGGDVIVPGGTMRINPENGEAIGQIEDASTAWWDYTIGNGPFYRLYYANDDEDPEDYHGDLMRTYRNNQGYLGGHMNFFQVPNLRVDVRANSSWFNSNFYIDDSDIFKGNIISQIEKLKDLSIYDAKNNNLKNAGTGTMQKVEKISGAWSYALAANGGLYEYNNENSSYNDLKALEFINDYNYVLDNIFNGDLLKYDSGYWAFTVENPAAVNVEVWNRLEGGIVEDLYDRTQPFLARKYGAGVWDTDESNERLIIFNELITKIEGRKSNFNTEGRQYFKEVTSMATNNVRVSELEGMNGDEYYFLYNTNPEKYITVDENFNGIIFTTGTVILEGGANVKGSIISAGGGRNNEGTFVPRAKDGIEINENTLKSLDRGDYAGVKFIEGGGEINVDFYLGLDPDDVLREAGFDSGNYKMLNKAARLNLLNKLDQNGINLKSVF